MTAALSLGRWLDESVPGVPGERAPADPEALVSRALLASEDAARRGDVAASSSHLAQALAGLASLPEHAPARLVAAARVDLVHARRALREGASPEVTLHARRALTKLARTADPPATTRLAALELQASTAIMQGAYERALRQLSGVAALAQAVGDPWIARIQRLIGAIHARRGRPLLAANAYLVAAGRLDEAAAPFEVAKLSSNLAMVSLMGGEVAAARTAIERALRLRTQHGAPVAELANSTAVLGLVAEREGAADAAAIWARAVALTRQGPDAVLTAEIELRAAIAAAERGDADAGEALLAAAVARVGAVGRIEPTVAAMAAEARARLRLADGHLDLAADAGRESLAAYRSIDAVYHVARLELLLALVARRAGAADGVVDRLAEACRLALRGGFELCWRPTERELLGAVAAAGDRDLRRYCRKAGIPIASDAAVLLVAPTGAIECFGERHELGAKAIPFRLALALVAAMPGAVTVKALCRKLWRAEGHDERTANRLKVHVHRLRELIGAERACVLTETTARRSEVVTSYRWNPAVPVRVVTRGQAPARARRR